MRRLFIRQRKEDGNMYIRDKQESKNSNGLSERKGKEDTLVSYAIRIAKLFSDNTVRLSRCIDEAKKMNE